MSYNQTISEQMANTTPRQFNRSVSLTDAEKAKVSYLQTKYPLQEERAKHYGIERVTMLRVEQSGTGRSTTIDAVRAKLKTVRLPEVVSA